jgi:hypothetical protein
MRSLYSTRTLLLNYASVIVRVELSWGYLQWLHVIDQAVMSLKIVVDENLLIALKCFQEWYKSLQPWTSFAPYKRRI